MDDPYKGSSINDVSSEGEGGGPPSKPIYYISLFSNLSQRGEGGGGVTNLGKWADVVYGWPLMKITFQIKPHRKINEDSGICYQHT